VAAAREGGCLCGALRYRLAGDPLTFYVCHCTDCQAQTGSAFGLSMLVPRSVFEVLEGEPRLYEVEMPDGRIKRACYCGECGTRLWGEPVLAPAVVTLRPGTFDDPSWAAPIAHIWTRSAQAWVAIPEDTLRFEGQPEDMMVLVRAWRERARG